MNIKQSLDDHDTISTHSGDIGKSHQGEQKVRNFLELETRSKASGSGQSGFHSKPQTVSNVPIVKVNYNNACDLERLEKFKRIVNDVASNKKLARIISSIFSVMTEVLPAQLPSMFIFKSELLENSKGKIKLDEKLLL